MAKGLDDNSIICMMSDWLEQGDVLDEIIDCANTAKDDYEHDHSD